MKQLRYLLNIVPSNTLGNRGCAVSSAVPVGSALHKDTPLVTHNTIPSIIDVCPHCFSKASSCRCSNSPYLDALQRHCIPSLLQDNLGGHHSRLEGLTLKVLIQLTVQPEDYISKYQNLCYTVLPDDYLKGVMKGLGEVYSLVTSKHPRFVEDNMAMVMGRVRLNQIGFENEHGNCGAVFDTLSYVNHSCVPNSEIEWEESGNWTLRSVREINEGEEVTFDYLGGGKDLGVAKRRQLLEEMWGFKCNCEACQIRRKKGKGRVMGKRLQLKKFK
ncbi:hypothetical protein TrST_g7439 [Triparma strigata]|uniref:SET domain-containing protein n=1 Tax=Triparma strigata TaxID=1606541 RepID=A0A9W7DR98_9STRA|nr:hypothetical protein TrST_g7439 [Triparma strigata]